MTVAKMWRRIPEQYALVGRRCKTCSNLSFPGREICASCGSNDSEAHTFTGKGKVITFTIIRTSQSDFDNEITERYFRATPYTLAIVKLEEGPMLTTEIVDSDDVKIGDKVEVAFRKILEKGDEGVIQYGYKFKTV